MELSMGDIALLGRVKRPVVTVWRRRHADGPAPFPAPVRTDPIRFASEDVLVWLSDTGLGNNPDPDAELAAIRLRESAPRDPGGVARLSAVMALRHLYGDSLVEDLARPERVMAAANSLDESNAFVVDLPGTDELPAMAQTVEEFVDHHLGVPDAHHWLTANWFRTAWPELSHTTLDPTLAELMARCAVAIADTADSPSVLDASGNGHSWLPLVPGDWEGRRAVAGAGPLARHTRRCLLLADGEVATARVSEAAPFAVDLALDADSADTQRRLALGVDRQMRLVVGPARDLCDPLPGADLREGVLRDGVVRAIVKLPPGLRATHPREHLAIWLVAERDEQPFDEQRTFVADLSGTALAPSVVNDLVGDLRAAALDPTTHGRRNWRVLHPVRTRHLLARPGSLAAGPPDRSLTASDPEQAVVQLERLGAATGLGEIVRLRPSGAPARTAVSVAEATRRKRLRALAGVRLGSDLNGGTVPVWSAGPAGVSVGRHVDRLAALALPRAWLTQPGDIVFHGAGAAAVDYEGGALVEYPVRALRVAAGVPIAFEQVARAIRSGARGTTAEHWQFGITGASRQAGLSVMSGRIRQRRAELLEQLQQLQDFEDTLFEACENQLVDLEVD